MAVEHPEIAARLRGHLNAWWDKVKADANEPQAVVIGHEAENPLLLSACEWRDVFFDQQQQVLRGDPKNSFWLLDVAEAGTYAFELRRWPREAARPLSAGMEPTDLHDGRTGPGRALPIGGARLHLAGEQLAAPVGPDDEGVAFTLDLPAGPQRLYTWFDDPDGRPLLGAYYVYVERLTVAKPVAGKRDPSGRAGASAGSVP